MLYQRRGLSRQSASQLLGVQLPGQGFPAPCQARRGLRATGQFILILQWARIVTESQISTAMQRISPHCAPISRKYNARTAKKRWPCTIPATRVFTRFSQFACFKLF
jgi:hypothetical protein